MVLKRGPCLLPKNGKLFNGTFLLTPRARLASLPVCSQACVPFLPGGVLSFQCTLSVEVFVYCSSLSVDGTVRMGRGHSLNTQR